MLANELSALSTSKPPGEPPQRLPTPKAETTATGTGVGRQETLFPYGQIREVKIAFHDPETGHELLAQVMQRLVPGLSTSLPALLADSPDPDGALLLFDRLIASSQETLRLLNQHHSLAHYAVVIFGHSRYLGETLIQNPDLLHMLLRERNLDQSFSAEEFHESLARYLSRSFETDISLLLARFKRREYIRIMLRDVLKVAPLAETTAEISALSDILIERALREAQTRISHRYDSPQHLDEGSRLVDTRFAVLSLGKLGGNELNYSSDIDLMYIFGEGEAPPQADISNREYFIRLAQQVTEILSRPTQEGPVFRIDLRLRPQGNQGELAVSLPHALQYYAVEAHDWERQALIKVRYSAGDLQLARDFIRSVQPHVYTEGVNFAAIKTALVAREKMQERRHHRPALEPARQSINIKIDSGGIRDIEFLVQCLQRVYGGGEPWLRSGGTLFSLQKLHDKGHVSGKEFHDLAISYEFLRHLEHRLQLRQGQQTHRLPATDAELRILQRSMVGYIPGEYRSAYLPAVVQRRMAAVAGIYQQIIYQQQGRQRRQSAEATFELSAVLDPGAVDHSNQPVVERLAVDAPLLYRTVAHGDLSLQARKNLFRFLWSALSTSERYAVVVRHPEAVVRALALFGASDYLTDVLVRHPEEIETLAELDQAPPTRSPSGYLFGSAQAAGLTTTVSDPVFAYLPSSPAPYAEKLALLRKHFRHRIFGIQARDIIERRGVYGSFEATTAVADDVVNAALEISGAPADLAVMALGRLGAREFDVLSDADMVFVSAEGGDRIALTRSAEQLTQALAAYTQDGMVFPVDSRLRPRGSEGELLSTPTQLAAYFENEAQAWEALTYTKLRFVAGSRSLAERAMAATEQLFARFAADATFREAVSEMRSKLEAAEAPEKSFKASPGAIYDIDFLTGYLLIANRIPDKSGGLRDRLWRLAEAGMLSKTDAACLDHTAELLRTVEHLVRLVGSRTRKWLPPTEHAAQTVEKLASQVLDRPFSNGLEQELLEACRQTRTIFTRVCGSVEP